MRLCGMCAMVQRYNLVDHPSSILQMAFEVVMAAAATAICTTCVFHHAVCGWTL